MFRNLTGLIFTAFLGACAVFSPVLPSRVVAYENLYNVIATAGLTTNLKLVLDAGDVDSYPGNGQKWLDRSGGGYDFFLGADGSATGTDPAFVGNAGNQSGNEYFNHDGGDYFTYDSANETWMNALGKAGSGTVLTVVYLASDADFLRIFSTFTASATDRGFEFAYKNDIKKFSVAYTNTADAFFPLGNAGPDVSASIPAVFLVALSWTTGADGTASYVLHVNGTNYSASGSGLQPPTTNNPTATAHLMSLGNAGSPAQSGSRIAMLAMWQGTALSGANFTTLWNALRTRYGL